MDPIANLIGYSVILLTTIAASAAILLIVLNYVLKKLHVLYRVGFIIGRWKRINYLMEHLPKQYWEDHADWRGYRSEDFRVPSNPEGHRPATENPV